jgi:uncharacterized protein (TIGR00297 family)
MLPLTQSIAWLSVMILMSVIAYKIKTIDKYGAFSAVPIGFIILMAGGISWFLILLLYFLLASYFTKYKYKHKETIGVTEAKSGARGWNSVLANGGPLAIFATMYFLSNNNYVYLLCFVGSVAFALSDTSATEIGLLSKVQPRSILSGKRIYPGYSGGISMKGEIAAILGSLAIGTACGILLATSIIHTLIIISAAVAAGMIATNIDSIFGETVQAKYRCKVCNKYAEKRILHCSIPVARQAGIWFVDNNTVNILGSAIGAVVASSFVLLL